MQLDFSEENRRKTTIGLTPLVDVIFILIVFFMLVSTFQKFRTIDVATAAGRSPTINEVHQLKLTAEGALLTLAGADANTLLEEAVGSGHPVVIHVTEGAPLQAGVDWLDKLTARGLSKVTLVPEG